MRDDREPKRDMSEDILEYMLAIIIVISLLGIWVSQ